MKKKWNRLFSSAWHRIEKNQHQQEEDEGRVESKHTKISTLFADYYVCVHAKKKIRKRRKNNVKKEAKIPTYHWESNQHITTHNNPPLPFRLFIYTYLASTTRFLHKKNRKRASKTDEIKQQQQQSSPSNLTPLQREMMMQLMNAKQTFYFIWLFGSVLSSFNRKILKHSAARHSTHREWVNRKQEKTPLLLKKLKKKRNSGFLNDALYRIVIWLWKDRSLSFDLGWNNKTPQSGSREF